MAKETRELTLGLLCIAFVLGGCVRSPEDKLRQTLASQTTGIIRLPTGVIQISTELSLAPGAHDLEIVGAGTLLKAADNFKGRAILVVEDARHIWMHDFSVDGDRPVLEKSIELPPSENAFRTWFPNNGILIDHADGIEIQNVRFSAVTNFAMLISRSSAIRVRGVQVVDSGSRNGRGRNNTSGGILLEEGASDFDVRECIFSRIPGNALWTHSNSASPRAQDGVFTQNRFDSVGRDAIQVGHATRIRVEDNRGERIGFPPEIVDIENLATPVAIDTAGNVDHSEYLRNQFEEINGKCIDLDGFHDGAVRDNRCVNRRLPQEYVFGQFGIVMNNTNPGMHSRNIEITGNQLDGTKFGGLFVIGSGHHITGNVFEHINRAGCNENAEFNCIYKQDEPEMLESGIYLGRGGARPEDTRDNIIRDNQISGHKMSAHCIVAAPGVSATKNTIIGNTCSDYSLSR